MPAKEILFGSTTQTRVSAFCGEFLGFELDLQRGISFFKKTYKILTKQKDFQGISMKIIGFLGKDQGCTSLRHIP